MLGAALALAVAASAPAPAAQRWPAAEARQGAAADARHVYAIGNNEIGKYDKRTGRRVAGWVGDRALFPHINSCSVNRTRLICAASNYPAVPHASSVEVFDTRRMQHVGSFALPPVPGSLTWLEARKGGGWWAGFANYDSRGGAPGRDHRASFVAALDERFVPVASWRFPESVLQRFAPYSTSGGAWGRDGLLYVTGHDRPEVYALRLPRAGTVFEHVATMAVANEGQAIAWDPREPRLLWSINRRERSLVATRVPNATSGAAHP
jgi:outer membrane protein assembly factor BamB